MIIALAALSPPGLMTRDEILLAGKEFLFPAVIHYFDEPLTLDHAKDQYVWDADGKQYLDFFGGIVTVSVGHRNEKVTRAIREQLDKLHHVSTLYYTEPQVALAKRIAEVSPGGKLTKSFFTNSGTEANETAIALARIHTGHHEIVALRHSYHGRTEAGRSLTGQGDLADSAYRRKAVSCTRTTPTAIAVRSV